MHWGNEVNSPTRLGSERRSAGCEPLFEIGLLVLVLKPPRRVNPGALPAGEDVSFQSGYRSYAGETSMAYAFATPHRIVGQWAMERMRALLLFSTDQPGTNRLRKKWRALYNIGAGT